MKTMSTYTVPVICGNCTFKKEDFTVMFGETVDDQTCVECGTNSLVKCEMVLPPKPLH